jgi:two-component system, sensor histidine kinase
VQGDSSLARSQGGLGIGLTLVRRLVELHGGVVVARSEGPGRGSEFEVRLPLGPIRETGEALPAERRPSRGLRLAIIEDNRDSREMLRTVLELQGHRVQDAAAGLAGVQLVITTAPDVVLVDIGLPGIDGYEVARRLRQRLGSAVRLIALTGYGDPDSKQMTATAGFDDHLVKPVSPEELARVLETLG